MKDTGQFWDAVHRALDERRDPLEDDVVQESIIANPRKMQELVDFLARLERVLPARRRRVIQEISLAFAIAASITLALSVAWLTSGDGAPVQQSAPTLGRVVSFEWELTTETTTLESSVRLTDRDLTARAEYRGDGREQTHWTLESTQPRNP